MNKGIGLLLLAALVTLTACFPSRVREITEISNGSLPLAATVRPSVQNVQLSPGTVLPPYGLKVPADMVILTLRVSTSQEEVESRFADIQQALDQMAALAEKNEQITLDHVSVGQIGGSSERATAVPYLESLDSSAVTVELSTPLAAHHQQLLNSLVAFNGFLSALELPESIAVQAVTVETAVNEPEQCRAQLIAQVYQELDAIQETYGPAVKFEITGLHGPLLTMPLSDTEYYLYLEPSVIVKEF